MEFNYDGTNYKVEVLDDKHILVGKENETKIIRVTHKKGYLVKMNKNSVGTYSLSQLMKHFEECVRENFSVHAWVVHYLELMLEMKGC